MQVGKSKIGRFLFFIGLILLVIFFAMDQAKNPSYAYLCAGVFIIILGALLMWHGRAPHSESMRFRTLRKWHQQQQQKKEEKKQKQPWVH
jgi:4-amino-4-deoxy-L-arabinose transferase-like glycosyltransferase